MTRAQGCLSDFTLDRRVAGELPPAEEAVAIAHLTTCADCTERVQQLAADQEAFAANAPPLRAVAAAKSTAPARRRHALVSAVTTVVALAAGVLLWSRTAPRVVGDETRLKGDATSLGFFVDHHGQVRRAGESGETVAPGDALRFVYSATTPVDLAIFSVDGAGQASIYFPAGPSSAHLEAGREVALGESTRLDDVVGRERLFGMFCAAPFAVETMRQELSRAPGQAPPTPAGCHLSTLTFDKRTESTPPPP